jgi:acetoacetyl-[acyl-carrier protein] synthase
MLKLPVIVGLGGINAAGRSSGWHSYKRMVCDVLSQQVLQDTWNDLACRMGVDLNSDYLTEIKQGTLVRKIVAFDIDNVQINYPAHVSMSTQAPKVAFKKSKIPPKFAQYNYKEDELTHDVEVELHENLDILIPDTHTLAVSSGGGIPTGFDPGALYNSHHHPRGIKFTVYAASDALNSLGIEWDEILKHIRPDQVSVYAGSALSQIDEYSFSGMIGHPLRGHRVTSKMMALSLCDMPADFINSYIINSIGATGNNVGACASYLYNLRMGCADIQSGRAKIAIIGNAEAPLVPEVIEGFRVMGALATDDSLRELDKISEPNHRRACRPFSTNTGFTLGESAQFLVLMDDELALKLGAHIYGSVADVFVNADANKKSISSPGVGNYVTMAKAVSLAQAILGSNGLQQTYVQAHGTGTPQNRTTESHILNEIAKTFAIKDWPVTSVKAYLGHSIGAAGGDQLMTALGAWQYGWIPGIKTIDHIATDVYNSNLSILMDHQYIGEYGINKRAVIINSKGFGGNNASALILSPQETLKILQQKYGTDVIKQHQEKHQAVKECSDVRDKATSTGTERIIYKFGESVMDQSSVKMTKSTLSLSDFLQNIELPTVNPYAL